MLSANVTLPVSQVHPVKTQSSSGVAVIETASPSLAVYNPESVSALPYFILSETSSILYVGAYVTSKEILNVRRTPSFDITETVHS